MTNAKNANANETTNVETKKIVHTTNVETYKTMRDDAKTRRNVRFSHENCAHRNDKNDRAKCRKMMQSQLQTFVYVESNDDA